MRKKKRKRLFCIPLFVSLLSFSLFGAQDLEALLQSLYAVYAPCGGEENLAGLIEQKVLPKGEWKKDNLGSIYLSLEDGEGYTACLVPMDEVGYIVSGKTTDGYLRLDRIVPADSYNDTFHPGHPMLILTETSSVSAVLALPSLHIFPRSQRDSLEGLFSLENFFLDIGASEEEDIKKRGVRLLDPVLPVHDWSVLAGKKRAGYGLGKRACCAVLVQTACKTVVSTASSDATFVWMAQTCFYHRSSRPRTSIGALRSSRILKNEKILILEAVPVNENADFLSLGGGPILVQGRQSGALATSLQEMAKEGNIPLQHLDFFSSSLTPPFEKDSRDVIVLGIPVKFSGTPAEVIDLGDAEAMAGLLEGFLAKRRQP
ncbi:MAG: hypothetical protein JXB26_02005 [Candidatus Aminicenantes bacterium]|nr:hypothetical protein [Candidatus Aminicenantes bacterium]